MPLGSQQQRTQLPATREYGKVSIFSWGRYYPNQNQGIAGKEETEMNIGWETSRVCWSE